MYDSKIDQRKLLCTNQSERSRNLREASYGSSLIFNYSISNGPSGDDAYSHHFVLGMKEINADF